MNFATIPGVYDALCVECSIPSTMVFGSVTQGLTRNLRLRFLRIYGSEFTATVISKNVRKLFRPFFSVISVTVSDFSPIYGIFGKNIQFLRIYSIYGP